MICIKGKVLRISQYTKRNDRKFFETILKIVWNEKSSVMSNIDLSCIYTKVFLETRGRISLSLSLSRNCSRMTQRIELNDQCLLIKISMGEKMWQKVRESSDFYDFYDFSKLPSRTCNRPSFSTRKFRRTNFFRNVAFPFHSAWLNGDEIRRIFHISNLNYRQKNGMNFIPLISFM